MFENIPSINFIAVIVAAVASVVLLIVFYNIWAKTIGLTEKPKMMVSYGVYAIGALVMSYVLANIIAFFAYYLDINGAIAGLTTGITVWLGFYTTVTLWSVIWEGKSWKNWLINSAYHLITIIAMSLIISMWPAK